MCASSPTAVTVLTAEGESLPPGLAPLAERVEVRTAHDEAGLRRALPGSAVLLVTDFRTGALERSWDAATDLRWIHATSAGVDALLFPRCIDSEVVLTNARGLFDEAIAEYVLGLILMFAKDSRRNVVLQIERRWEHRDTERVAGRRVLVVGAGSIGGCIARLCVAVGMHVEGIARAARRQEPFVAVHAIDDLHEHLGRADFVVVAAPLTSDTRGLFGAREFAAMAPGARLINIGRGPIVDTDALVTALRDGAIAGAGLDVFEEEPLPPEHPLWGFENVLISAHMAGDFVGWREALSRQFLDNLDRWLRGEPLFNVVDKRRLATTT